MASEKWLCQACGLETTGDVCEWCGMPKEEMAQEEEQQAVELEEIKNATAPIEESSEDISEEFGADDLSEFEAEIFEIEEEAEISEDLEGFAKGFPDWDLHPPKSK